MKTPLEVRASSPISFTLRLACALGALAVVAAPGRVDAQSANWIGTAGTGGAGTWDTVGDWSTPSTVPGTTTSPATTTNTDVATFAAATGGTVTLAAARDIGGITETSGTAIYAIGASTGSPTLYLTSGGEVQTMATGDAFSINAPIIFTSSGTTASYTFDEEPGSSGRPLDLQGGITGAPVSGTTTITLQGSGASAINLITKAIADGTGGGSTAVIKNGAGTWRVYAGTYSGGTTINAGTLDNYNAISTTTTFGTGTITMNGGTLGLDAASSSTNTLNSPLVVNNSNTFAYRAYAAANVIFAPQSMSGTGTLTFSPSSLVVGNATAFAGYGSASTGVVNTSGAGAFGTFGGNVNVAGITISSVNYTATLSLTNAFALSTATGTVSVNALGILTSTVANTNLGGSLTLAGGTISPNGTSAGLLTLTAGNFSMTSGTLMLTLTNTTSFDEIASNGAGVFSLTGGTLDLGGVTAAAGNSYQVLNGFASGTVSGIMITDYMTGDGSQPVLNSSGLLTFVAVPEPGTVALFAYAGLLGLTFAAVRRRMARA
jgi:autotransporter-associated beta strand protein